MKHASRSLLLSSLALLSTLFLLLFMASCVTTAPTGEGLVDLVRKGDRESLKKIQEDQVRFRNTVNQKDEQGLYPLHYAVGQDDTTILRILLAFDATIDVQDPAGKTPLRYAIDRGKVEAAQLLIGKNEGANPFVQDASGSTPADAALGAGSAMIKAVFTARTINISGADGRTALHMASDRLLKDVVYQLLDLGALVQNRDKAGRTALDLALLYPDRVEAAYIAERLIQRGVSPAFPEFAWFSKAVRATDYNAVRFDNDNTPLHEAVARRQKGFLIFLLDRKTSLNARNRSGNAPLHEAVRTGWMEGTQLLLSGGADPNIRNAEDDTPLHVVIPQASTVQMLKLLLKNGSDPSLKNRSGDIALHVAVRSGYPLDAITTLTGVPGAVINAANAAGDTPLILAVRSSMKETATALVEKGADIFVQNLAKESSLSLAIAAGADTVKAIITSTTVSQRDNQGNGVLATAVQLRAPANVLSLMIERKADPNMRNSSGDTALHIATRLNYPEQGTVLLNAKADIFPENSRGESPLTIGLQYEGGPLAWLFTAQALAMRDPKGNSPLHYAARRNLGAGVEYLIEKDRSLLDAINAEKQTALHAAATIDATAALRSLLALGAAINKRDASGNAPIAVAVSNSSLESMKILVLAGADVDIRNFVGESPLHKAVLAKSGPALQYLLDHGAKPESRDSRGLTILASAVAQGTGDQTTAASLAKIILGAGAAVDARDLSGKTSLYYAVEAGSTELIRILMAAGADFHARDKDGSTPLQRSFGKGIAVLRELLGGNRANKADSEGRAPLSLLVAAGMSQEHLDTALSAGADPDTRDMYSKTALHVAIARNDYISPARLIQAGADLFAPDSEMKTPAELVLEAGSVAIRAIVEATVKAGLGGASVADALGNTLLHYAARQGKAEAIKVLLELGAERTAKNAMDETAYDIAVKQGQRTAAELLAGK